MPAAFQRQHGLLGNVMTAQSIKTVTKPWGREGWQQFRQPLRIRHNALKTEVKIIQHHTKKEAKNAIGQKVVFIFFGTCHDFLTVAIRFTEADSRSLKHIQFYMG
ncbi:hypothetical protein [Paenibacillus sinensis]|uniref:hypothetical protein n=1 Tax=Paenibacillus sinensis TaxID=2834413 RepID=UPI001CA9D807|nr:hypothetical protein [Paenibacillus sinensis]